MAKFCRYCGQPKNDNSRFCRYCGMKLEDAVQPAQQLQQIGGMAAAAAMRAPSAAGFSSFDMGLSGSPLSGMAGGAGEIMAPLMAVTSIFRRIPQGFKNIGKKPAAIIVPIVLSLFWIVLFFLRRTGHANNLIAGFFSWLSFGQDSGERSIFGVFGDILGKSVVAMGFTSLLTGGIGFMRTGAARLLNRDKSVPEQGNPSFDPGLKQNLPWLLCGAGGALVANRFLAGAPSWSRSMAVIASLVMVIQSFGNTNSWLYGIAASLTAKVGADGKRTTNTGGIRTIMTGFTAGFALMLPVDALVSIVRSIEGSLFFKVFVIMIIGSLPFIAGFIMLIAGIVTSRRCHPER